MISNVSKCRRLLAEHQHTQGRCTLPREKIRAELTGAFGIFVTRLRRRAGGRRGVGSGRAAHGNKYMPTALYRSIPEMHRLLFFPSRPPETPPKMLGNVRKIIRTSYINARTRFQRASAPPTACTAQHGTAPQQKSGRPTE